jgi:hypothetical protein
MTDRRVIIEFALLMIVMTVLGGIARNVLPEVHQLLRFGLVALVTVLVWLAARLVLRRFETD